MTYLLLFGRRGESINGCDCTAAARSYKVTKNLLKNERTYMDGIPKKQPNKVGMVPQYPYGLSSLYLLPFLQLVPTKAKLYSSSIDLFSS